MNMESANKKSAYRRKSAASGKAADVVLLDVGVTSNDENILTHPPKKPSKPASKKITVDPKLKAMYKKWQKEARERGGHCVIVEKGAAKKLIFDTLIHVARPMTLLQL
jgi:hypothetical protein